jgi:hypothetical protein
MMASSRPLTRLQIFGLRRSRLLRTTIPLTENLSVALLGLLLIGLLIWVIGTGKDFDPTERDLPVELQSSNARNIPIYRPPLKPWVDPARPVTSGTLDLAPFPADILDAEWQPVGRVKHFQAANLFEKINGEAEKFIKQGFVELAYLLLRSNRDDSEIAIELFDQGNLAGSLGVFAEHAAGRRVEELGGVNFFTTGAGVIGRVDRYFFRAAGDRSNEAIATKALSLVKAFGALAATSDAAAGKAEVPAGFALLHQRLGIPEKHIQFQEANVFQYDFARRFWFANAGIDSEARLFIHVGEDAATAEVLIDALLQEQRYDYDLVADDGNVTILRHRFLKTHFVITRQDEFVFGLEGLEDKEAAADWLARIRKSLSDDQT